MKDDISDILSASEQTARWHADYHEVVERVYRSRLRSVPDHIKDGIQSFWLAFIEEKLFERFDETRCPSKSGFVGVLAQGRAMNLLHKLWGELKRQEPGDDID